MQRELRNLTPAECVQAVLLHEEGWRYRPIGERFGVSYTSVTRMVRNREAGEHARRTGQGRNRVTNLGQDRFLRLSALRLRFVTTRLLQCQLQNAHDIQVSLETIRQRLLKGNLCPRIAA